MQCKNCGSPASDAAIYCPACGQTLNPAAAPYQQRHPESPEQPYPNQQQTQQPVQPVASYQSYDSQKDKGYDFLTTLLLAIFLGNFGVHRFYTGHMGLGVLMLLTQGLCGIMYIVDIILIVTDSYKDAQGRALIKK